MKGIDTLTQEDIHGAFQKLLDWYNKCIATRGDYFEVDKRFMCVLSIKVPIRKQSGKLLCAPCTLEICKEYWNKYTMASQQVKIRTYCFYYQVTCEKKTKRGCPRGVMVKAMDCGIVVREFVLQSRYYVHFRANTLGERYEPPYPPSYGLNSTTTVLLGEWLWH